MVRCVVNPQQCVGDRVTLDAKQTKHLTTVLRLRPGDEFLVASGAGEAQVAVLEAVSRGSATARRLRPVPVPPPEPWQVTLAAAVPRHPGAFDQIVDQATQLGVAAIVPLMTARTVVRPDMARLAARHRRWTRLAVEAAQQSGRPTIPRIESPTTLDEVLARRGAFDCMVMPAVVFGAPDLSREISGAPRRVLLAIGPEGDFTPDEVLRATTCHAHIVSLGPTILRCETAVVAALAVLFQALRAGGRENSSA